MPHERVNSRAGLRALVFGVVLVVLGWHVVSSARAEEALPTRTISQALAVPSNAAQFPAAADATPQTLPDDWSLSHPGFEGSVWYRVNFDAPPAVDGDDVLALYVERACTNLEVHLNGRRIFSGGRMEEPVTRNCYQPQLVTLPAALLQAGEIGWTSSCAAMRWSMSRRGSALPACRPCASARSPNSRRSGARSSSATSAPRNCWVSRCSCSGSS